MIINSLKLRKNLIKHMTRPSIRHPGPFVPHEHVHRARLDHVLRAGLQLRCQGQKEGRAQQCSKNQWCSE